MKSIAVTLMKKSKYSLFEMGPSKREDVGTWWHETPEVMGPSGSAQLDVGDPAGGWVEPLPTGHQAISKTMKKQQDLLKDFQLVKFTQLKNYLGNIVFLAHVAPFACVVSVALRLFFSLRDVFKGSFSTWSPSQDGQRKKKNKSDDGRPSRRTRMRMGKPSRRSRMRMVGKPSRRSRMRMGRQSRSRRSPRVQDTWAGMTTWIWMP